MVYRNGRNESQGHLLTGDTAWAKKFKKFNKQTNTKKKKKF